MRILKNVKGISFVELGEKDIVRHKLVMRIVDAYAQDEKKRRLNAEAKDAKTHSDAAMKEKKN